MSGRAGASGAGGLGGSMGMAGQSNVGAGGAAGGGTAGAAGGGASGTTGAAGGGAAGGTSGSGGGAAGASGGGAGGQATAGNGGGAGAAGAAGSSGNLQATCGNGVLDPGEQCDDHNKLDGDGCTALCQIENGWGCPSVGKSCLRTALCGDGLLAPTEACDDSNTQSGDGCSSDCRTVEAGWRCPFPGKPCVPICGDNMIAGNESCDDGNTNNGDGCSSTCQIEPGGACPVNNGRPAPGRCTKASCGNGVVEVGESCDCGTSPTTFPAGCTGPNGLFNGDGTGCSTTCSKEPVCRNTAGKTLACTATCGNGNLETGEDCDDGNQVSGDGCSSGCKIEAGYSCTTVATDGSVACLQPGNTGKCLELPVKYRDYKNEDVSGGHPDFFYLGATVANPPSISGVDGQPNPLSFSKRYCVPNAAGPSKQVDSVDRCWDLAQVSLDANGKPQFNTARNGGGASALLCNCQFTDFSNNGNGGHVYGYSTLTNGPLNGIAYTGGAYGDPMYRGPAPIVTSAASFGDGSPSAKGWWTDNAYNGNSHTIGTLELAATGTTAGQYQFTSQPNLVLGGFFPLDPPNQFSLYGAASGGPGPVHTVGTEQLLCNLWPYWYSPYANSTNVFGGGAGCTGDQYLYPPGLMSTTTRPYTAANWNTTVNAMYPGGNWYTSVQGWFHDFWFSDEARTLFTFNGPFSVSFSGADDTFIFINGILVADLGGVHQQIPAQVSVDANGLATITEGGSLDATGTTILPCATTTTDPYTAQPFNTLTGTNGEGQSNCTNSSCDCRTRTANLGLTVGNTYELAIFGANRHPVESSYQLGLSGLGTNESQCRPLCGDGITIGREQCDCGDGTLTPPTGCQGPNNDTTYNGCTTACTKGPFCGDGIVNSSAKEQCDDGAQNGVAYTQACHAGGCTSSCTLPSCCGDGIVDADEGEECDFGSANGTPGAPCSSDCKIIINLDPNP